ncbi:hypothetical protein [Streptomyces viridosporus]|uniref:hypothetical protein n=1 Tax=Streptomyces viridosporus TaxID=67581 RepID=UPI0033183752
MDWLLAEVLGVGGFDVLHRGFGGDPEDAHQVDGVGILVCFVEDSVDPEPARLEPELSEDRLEAVFGDGRPGGIKGGPA